MENSENASLTIQVPLTRDRNGRLILSDEELDILTADLE